VGWVGLGVNLMGWVRLAW